MVAARRTRGTRARGLIVLLNDRLTPAARATISALDRGFLYGDGLFETVRAYGGRPFGLEQHLARLAHSARAFRIPFERDAAYWRPRIATLLRANDLATSDAAVRLTISRGAGALGLLPPPRLRPTTLLVASRLDARLPAAHARGVGVRFFPYRLVTATLPSHKTLHYLPAVLGKILAARARVWESLYLSADDTVLEGTTSNVFIVRRGTVVTPPLRGILPGVTRRFLESVARRAGIPLREAAIPRQRLLEADEVFLTASTIEVMPVVRVERRVIGGGTPGPVTRQLQEEYARLVTATLARTVKTRATIRSASAATRRR